MTCAKASSGGLGAPSRAVGRVAGGAQFVRGVSPLQWRERITLLPPSHLFPPTMKFCGNSVGIECPVSGSATGR